jgi:hypothetical protein
LRDVPKDVTIKHIADKFPDAISFTLYDKTFPASKFWYYTKYFKKALIIMTFFLTATPLFVLKTTNDLPKF